MTITTGKSIQVQGKAITTPEFVRAVLSGIGQVMFQDNALTGAFFLVGLLAASWQLAVAALLGSFIATLTAVLLQMSPEQIKTGLTGYNGVLVSLALVVFLSVDAWLLVFIIIGAMLSTFMTAATNSLLEKYDLPALTAPFVFATWVLLLASLLFTRVAPDGLAEAALPTMQRVSETAGLDLLATLQGVVTGVGQVMFSDYLLTGVLFIVGLAVNSVPSALLAILGSLTGGLTALLFAGPPSWVPDGLFGFNAALVAVALGCIFDKPSVRVTVIAFIGAIVSTFVFGAMGLALQPFGLSALTMPFVVTTWIFLLAKKQFTLQA